MLTLNPEQVFSRQLSAWQFVNPGSSMCKYCYLLGLPQHPPLVALDLAANRQGRKRACHSAWVGLACRCCVPLATGLTKLQRGWGMWPSLCLREERGLQSTGHFCHVVSSSPHEGREDSCYSQGRQGRPWEVREAEAPHWVR